MSTNSHVTEIQLKSLEIFKEFLIVCKKYNLRYFLIGGSCLGAVRHKGFIPWDDDIDIGMPRSDYNEFLKIAQLELPPYLFVQNETTDQDFILNFTKIRNSNTTFIETNLSKLNINHGLFIDVFPLDGYRGNFIFSVFNRLLLSRTLCKVQKNSLKNILKILVCLPFAPTYKIARNLRNKLLQKVNYDDSEIIANYCGAWGQKEIMSKEIFGDGSHMEFEGIDVIVPKKYDLYLKNVYGDYMQLPPIEKRITHHNTEIIDLYNSYMMYR